MLFPLCEHGQYQIWNYRKNEFIELMISVEDSDITVVTLKI